MLYRETKKKIRKSLKELHDLSTEEDHWEGFQSAVLEEAENSLWRLLSILDMAVRITDRPGEYNPLKSIEHAIHEASSEVSETKINHEKGIKEKLEKLNDIPDKLPIAKDLDDDPLTPEEIKIIDDFTGITSDQKHYPIITQKDSER